MYGTSFLLLLFILFGSVFFNLDSGGSQGSGFQDKVMHSINEMLVTNYDDVSDISSNWRGYEAYLGFSKYYSGSLPELLFGQGYGAVVYTPYWIFKGELPQLDIIPIFHNGYITILLKTGAIGLILFFILLYVLLNTATNIRQISIKPEQVLASTLLQANVFIIFFFTFFIHGIFSITPPLLLLVLVGVNLQLISVNNIKK